MISESFADIKNEHTVLIYWWYCHLVMSARMQRIGSNQATITRYFASDEAWVLVVYFVRQLAARNVINIKYVLAKLYDGVIKVGYKSYLSLRFTIFLSQFIKRLRGIEYFSGKSTENRRLSIQPSLVKTQITLLRTTLPFG